MWGIEVEFPNRKASGQLLLYVKGLLGLRKTAQYQQRSWNVAKPFIVFVEFRIYSFFGQQFLLHFFCFTAT